MARDIVARNPAPAYSAEGLAHLVQEIDALLGHLARAEPGALEACFMDSRNPGTAPSKVAPPRGTDIAPDTLRGFIERVAGITGGFSARVAGGMIEPAALISPQDYAYLLEVRSFLAQLVLPASVDTILVTQGYHDGLACLARTPGVFRRIVAEVGAIMPRLHRDRRGGPAMEPCSPDQPNAIAARGLPRLHQATESGWRFAGYAKRLRRSAVIMVFVTLIFALYVFAGKTLQEEAQRLQAAVGSIQQQIDSDFGGNAARGVSAADRAIAAGDRLVQLREAAFVFDATLPYCDQPFLDDTGIIRYARPSQELNCNRLWGVNRSVNQNNRQMQAWITPAMLPPFSWLFGLFYTSDPNATVQVREQGNDTTAEELRRLNQVGLLRVFPENARVINISEAEALAVRRGCETAERTKLEVQVTRNGGPSAPDRGTTPDTETGQPLTQQDAIPAPVSGSASAQPLAASRGMVCGPGLRNVLLEDVVRDRDRIVRRAIWQFVTLNLALPINEQTERASPIRVRVVIEGLTLYVLPVMFAVLGSFVSVLREIRRRADAALLTLTEHSRMLTTLVLGASFGAVVSLLAEILRSGGTAAPSATAISLGLWPLAFLAGYAVSHVFRMLDAAVDRIFGQRQPPDRPAAREA
jgi:hypothetical protein